MNKLISTISKNSIDEIRIELSELREALAQAEAAARAAGLLAPVG